MKQNKLRKTYFAVIFFCVLVLPVPFGIIGCIHPSGKEADNTPPAEVASLTAVGENRSVLLQWRNPSDADFLDVEISAEPAHGTLKRPVLVNGVQRFTVSNLKNGTEYTFTVKTLDKNLNYSRGSTIKAKPVKSGYHAGDPMELLITQTPAANVTTNGAVTITIESNTSIRRAKWTAGVKTAKEVFDFGTDIIDNSFQISENGVYSIGVQDNDGRREVEKIEIVNIDKIPPVKVQNLMADYDSGTKKISVSWTASIDSAHYLVSCTKAGEAFKTDEKTAGTSYSLTEIESDGMEYVFTVTAVDTAGNRSEAANSSVTASHGPYLSSISLSPTRLAYNAPDLTIRATLKGNNFDLIASQSDSSVKAGIFDEEGVLLGGLKLAHLDIAANEGSVTLTAPKIDERTATLEGKRYTVKVKFCGKYAAATADFAISKEARLTAKPELSITQIASSGVSAGMKTTLTITGVNLDVAGGIYAQLYSSDNKPYGMPTPIIVFGTIGGTPKTLTADIPVPATEGVFTVKILFGSTVQTRYYEGSQYDWSHDLINPIIQVYGKPNFSAFHIPKAGIGKADGTVTATVWGVNFQAPDVSASDFTVSCPTASITTESVIKVVSDIELTLTLTIPAQANEYTVTIASGENSTNGTFTVKDYQAYKPGTIILKDGTFAVKDTYTAIDSNNPPVAVIAGTNTYGAALGIALHSGSNLQWAKEKTTGDYTEFTGIACIPSVTGNEAAAAATFTGDIDGSDNWDYICRIDPVGTAKAGENYPAFYWVNMYNITYAASLGGADIKWYLPSLAELCVVSKNHRAINESLAKIHGIDNTAADKELAYGYWSSSQGPLGNDSSWTCGTNGNIYNLWRPDKNPVCCMTSF